MAYETIAIRLGSIIPDITQETVNSSLLNWLDVDFPKIPGIFPGRDECEKNMNKTLELLSF